MMSAASVVRYSLLVTSYFVLVINYNNLLLFNLGNPITVVSYILPGNGNELWITFLITLHLTRCIDYRIIYCHLTTVPPEMVW